MLLRNWKLSEGNLIDITKIIGFYFQVWQMELDYDYWKSVRNVRLLNVKWSQDHGWKNLL